MEGARMSMPAAMKLSTSAGDVKSAVSLVQQRAHCEIQEHTFKITRIRNSILTTFYPSALRLNCNASIMTFFRQDLRLLEVLGFVVMRHVHHDRIDW